MSKPAHIFTTSKNGITVVTHLYGEVSTSRLVKEQALANRRVEMLQPPSKQELYQYAQKRPSIAQDYHDMIDEYEDEMFD